jgi:hypothetical protein
VDEKEKTEFERAASEQRSPGFLRELWGFQKQTAKWWLAPVLLLLLLLSVIGFLSGTGAAPFIYAIF